MKKIGFYLVNALVIGAISILESAIRKEKTDRTRDFLDQSTKDFRKAKNKVVKRN